MPFGARDNKFKSNAYKSSMHMIFIKNYLLIKVSGAKFGLRLLCEER